jgi:hypothetical protein
MEVLSGPVTQGMEEPFFLTNEPIRANERARQVTNYPAKSKRAWQDSNLRHTAPETVALSPELQARARVGPPGDVTVTPAALQRAVRAGRGD